MRTVILEAEAPLHKEKVAAWIEKKLLRPEQEVSRSKGSFSFAGEDCRYEFQSVKNTFNLYAQGRWEPGDLRKSRLTLICTEKTDCGELQRTLEECI